MQETYKIGNAQTIGTRQIQSSYFATETDGCNEAAAVLADGTIDHINGRRCAVLAVETCMQEFRHVPDSETLSAFFDTTAVTVQRLMHEFIYLGKQPCLSLGMQLIRGQELFYYNIGSSRMFLYDGLELRFLKKRNGKEVFKKGMTAGLISKGVWEALNEKDTALYLSGKLHPYEKAQRMISGVIEKNRKEAGNAAVVLIEGCL